LHAVGVFLALFYVAHKFQSSMADPVCPVFLRAAIPILCALALFSRPSRRAAGGSILVLLFIIGSSRRSAGFATMSPRFTQWLATARISGTEFSALNVIGQEHTNKPVSTQLFL